MVRVDSEDRRWLTQEHEAHALEGAAARLAQADVCVLCDYAKGVVTPRLARTVIEMARQDSKPVVVDPKGVDFAKYAGATLVTPNSDETARAAGVEIEVEDDLWRAAARLMETLGESRLLVTRGPRGMSLFQDGRVTHLPTEARTVFDITGAGDTVVAMLALALAAGAPLAAAARLANRAAGIVVGKVGTATVSLAELAAGVR